MLDSLKNIDHFLFHFINQTMHNTFFDWCMPIFRNAQTWIPLYILLAAFCIFRFRQQSWMYILYILIAFAISDSLIHEFLKPWFGRIRPCHDALLQVRLLLSHCGGEWSFPSSHASNHMALAISIILAQLFGTRWINYLWLAWPLLIGFAQIYVGVHYPADILAGFMFGTSVAIFNYFVVLQLFKQLHLKFMRKKV